MVTRLVATGGVGPAFAYLWKVATDTAELVRTCLKRPVGLFMSGRGIGDFRRDPYPACPNLYNRVKPCFGLHVLSELLEG
jgi:hypothetical protein